MSSRNGAITGAGADLLRGCETKEPFIGQGFNQHVSQVRGKDNPGQLLFHMITRL